MIWLECENAIEVAPQISDHLGWNLKGIRETFGVPIYDRQLAICVSTLYGIYDPGTRTIPESCGIFQKQSSGIWWIGLSWGLLMGGHTLENAQRW
jgi:hypothetical protein